MKDYLKKNGLRVGILLAAAALIIGLSAAARGGRIGFVQNAAGVIKAPMQKVLSSAVNWFDSIYGYLYKYDSLLAENESLRSQLADAQKSARDGIEASEENTRLRRLLELREKHTDYVLESCKVVLWSSSNWSSSFTISKGSSSGIELGDPVITEYGAVVGQVTELGTNWATVSTLIDVDMSVGAFVGAAGNSGMVVGEYSFMRQKRAKLTYLADGAQIFVGDDVLTSGSGGAFPRALNDILEKLDLTRLLRYALFMLLTLMFQNMVLSHIRPLGVCPLVLPAAAAAVGMFEGATFGPVFSLIMGYFADMSFVENRIFFLLLLPVLSLLAAFVSQFFINRRFFAFMGLSLLSLVITSGLQILKTMALDAWSTQLLLVGIFQTLWSLPFSALAYFLPARWSRE